METGEQGEKLGAGRDAGGRERLLWWKRIKGRARLLGWRRLVQGEAFKLEEAVDGEGGGSDVEVARGNKSQNNVSSRKSNRLFTRLESLASSQKSF